MFCVEIWGGDFSDGIANAVALRYECTCSWPLLVCGIAMPCIRRALALSSGDSDEPLVFDEQCQCPLSSVSLAQRIRSFAWLTKQHASPSQFIFCLSLAPPRLFCSLMRSSLFPSLSSLTFIDFYFSRSQPSPPRLLFSLLQAPCLESLLLTHGVASDDDHELARYHCNE
ncbi:unnamed protein product [Closterium sp. NIES-54]